MQTHLRYHLERLALFSPPTEDVDGDSGASEGSSDSQQVIQGCGRQASLEQDFGDGSDFSSSQLADCGPTAEQNKPALMGILGQHASPGPGDEPTLIRRWIEMLAITPDDHIDSNMASTSGDGDTSSASQRLAQQQATQSNGKLNPHVANGMRNDVMLTSFTDNPGADVPTITSIALFRTVHVAKASPRHLHAKTPRGLFATCQTVMLGGRSRIPFQEPTSSIKLGGGKWA